MVSHIEWHISILFIKFFKIIYSRYFAFFSIVCDVGRFKSYTHSEMFVFYRFFIHFVNLLIIICIFCRFLWTLLLKELIYLVAVFISSRWCFFKSFPMLLYSVIFSSSAFFHCGWMVWLYFLSYNYNFCVSSFIGIVFHFFTISILFWELLTLLYSFWFSIGLTRTVNTFGHGKCGITCSALHEKKCQ